MAILTGLWACVSPYRPTVPLAAEIPKGEQLPIDGVWKNPKGLLLRFEGSRAYNVNRDSFGNPPGSVYFKDISPVPGDALRYTCKTESHHARSRVTDFGDCELVVRSGAVLEVQGRPNQRTGFAGGSFLLENVSLDDPGRFAASLAAAVAAPEVESTTTKRAALPAPDQALCVVVPADAGFQSHVHRGSGQIVAARIEMALAKVGRKALPVPSDSDGTNEDEYCRAHGGSFLVRSQILHWEDRAAGWSGLPDRIQVEVILYGLEAEAPIDKRLFVAQSNLLYSAFFEWGNNPPKDLLNERFDRLVAELVGAR